MSSIANLIHELSHKLLEQLKTLGYQEIRKC